MSQERLLLENCTTAVLQLDQHLHIQYINVAGEILLGVSRRHIKGMSLPKLVPTSNQFIETLKHAMDTQQTFTQRELRLVLPDQRVLTVDYSVTPIPENRLLIELHQVDRHVRISREENLLAQSAALTEMTKGLAHEVRNPLGGIRGAAQLLAKELDSEEWHEYTDIIIQETDRLQALVNRILGPKGELNRKPTNVHEVLERVRSILEVDENHNVCFERDFDPSIPPVIGLFDQLVQAILNIVRNAVEAINGKGGTIVLRTRTARQITLGNTRHKLVCQIDIEDDGNGISEDMLDKIFLPMITDKDEGTGLGLPIAQSIVCQHGGLIECNSQPGKTIFTVYLPLEQNL